MPTPEHHATAVIQAAGLVTALLTVLFSPITWSGLIGAAIGVAYSEPTSYKRGLICLFLGVGVSLATNSFLVEKIGDYAAGLAFGVALLVSVKHKVIFSALDKIVERKGDQV